MITKKLRLILALVVVLMAIQSADAKWPVRYWDDDMPRHTFSLGMGPALYPDSNPVLNNISGLPRQDITAVGFELALRYDWSYFKGYEVSLATGGTYIFAHGSFVADGGLLLGDLRVRETFNYLGANLVNTKMWFGRRTIWDVCIHMGYAGVYSRLVSGGPGTNIWENGFMAGLSTGMDFLVTAWLGVGVHANVMTGMLYPSGSEGSRQYTRGSLRVGAVYCF